MGGHHVLLILHALFDKAELENGQRHDHDHQYHRLRCRSAQIKRLEAIVINLVNQNGCVLARPALRGGIDNAESVEKGINHVHDQQKESGGRKQRKLHRPKTPPRPRAVNGRRLDQGFGNGLQAGQKKQEVVGNLFPHRRHHDQRHGVAAVHQVIPVQPGGPQPIADHADGRREHEEPQNPGHGGRHRVRPDEQGFVDGRALDHPVGHHGQHERERQPQRRHER